MSRHSRGDDVEARARRSEEYRAHATGADLPLFAPPPAPSPNPAWLDKPTTELENRFADFHRKNPHVYEELERIALAQLGDGSRPVRIGVGAIAEQLRYDPRLKTRSADFKINNSYRAFFARLLVHYQPQLSKAIELREQLSKQKSEDAA